MSGPLAPYGKNTLAGIEQRVREINDAGGVHGVELKLVAEDDKGDPAAAKTAFKKLTGIDRVVTVIGPITSTNVLKILADTKRQKIPTITPTATNDGITAKKESPYIFRACFNDSFQGQVIASYALHNLKVMKAAVMIDLGSDYSKGLSATFAKAFLAGGGELVAEEKYQQKDVEFGAQLTKIRDSGAQLVLVPGYPPEVPLIVKQAGTMGLTAKFCGADGWDDPAVIQNAGDKIIGSFMVGAFSIEDRREVVQRFIGAMGEDAGSFEALGYDAVSLLGEAMKNGSTPEQIREGLLAIRGFGGVTGIISIEPNGDATKGAVIFGIEKQGDKYVKKFLATVNPQ